VDLETLVAELAPRLVAYAIGRTGCRSIAEDVAQEALSALVARWRRFGPPDSPEAFVFTIARRRAARAVARRALLLPLDAVFARRGGASATETYERRTELQEVMRAMRKLRKADRDVLLLRAAGELPLDQIAKIAGISVAAVKMRLHRARTRLAQLIEE
jgi:RNA polymerase sigma-70 factor (ECF subfamily)